MLTEHPAANYNTTKPLSNKLIKWVQLSPSLQDKTSDAYLHWSVISASALELEMKMAVFSGLKERDIEPWEHVIKWLQKKIPANTSLDARLKILAILREAWRTQSYFTGKKEADWFDFIYDIMMNHNNALDVINLLCMFEVQSVRSFRKNARVSIIHHDGHTLPLSGWKNFLEHESWDVIEDMPKSIMSAVIGSY